MKLKVAAIFVAGVALLFVSGTTFAHHSKALYDKDHPVTLNGTVTDYLFTNPHVQIHFEVKDESGSVEKWIAESGPPQRLYRIGWNAKSLKQGDKITVTGPPLKDGRKLMSVQKLDGANVKTLNIGADRNLPCGR